MATGEAASRGESVGAGAARSPYVGRSVAPIEHRRLLRADGRYLDDLPVHGAVHAAFVRSPHARARIVSVDTSRARGSGVVAAITAADIADRVTPIHAPVGAPGYCAPPRPLLPEREVRFAGEPVAVVVAGSPAAAADAAAQIRVDYEALDALVDMERALDPGAPRVHDKVEGNVLFQGAQAFGDVDAQFARAEVIVTARFRTERITGIPLEPRGCLAIPDPSEDGLTIWAPSQAPHVMRTIVAECLKMPESKVRVRVPDIGGGFGIKIPVYPEEVLVAYLARALGRPVKWVQQRREDLQASAHCREQVYEVELAARRTGEFLALRARVLSDNGAFALPPQGAVLQSATVLRILPGAYRFAAYACAYVAVATNKSPAGAYRGVSQPAAIFAIERLVDRMAARLGRDPADLRLQNLVDEHAPSRDSITGNAFDNASFRHSLQVSLDRIGYASLRAQQAAHPEAGIGIGIAVYPESTGLGSAGWRARGITRVTGFDAAHVRMLPDGTVAVASSVPAIGQGHDTMLAQIVADALGTSIERVHVSHADTAATPYGTGCFASRGVIAGGGAAARAARALAQKIRTVAARLLECSDADVVLADDAASPAGVPARRISLEAIARAAHFLTAGAVPPGLEAGLEASAIYDPPPVTFANGCHVAVVRVDREVGTVEVLRYLVTHDCGRVVNPLLVDGQLRGAVVQGIASALSEQLVYDDAGQLLTGSLMDYPLPRADAFPDIDVAHLDNPSPTTEGGFKGVGESGIVGAPAAIANAIADAVPSIGSELTALPVTPERLWRWLARDRGEPAA